MIETRPGKSNETQTQLVLRFLRGLHAGAERRLGPHEVILIGSSDDCDLILSDAGVAHHHCIVSVIAGGLSVRPLDAPVELGTRSVAHGDSALFEAFAPISIGEAAFAVGAADSDRWQELSAESPAVAASAKRGTVRRYLALGAAGFAVCTATVALTANALRPVPKAEPVPQRAAVEEVLRELDLSRVHIAANGHGGFDITGQAPDNARVEFLRRDLAARGIAAAVDIRTGEDLAKDVGEVLRLSGIEAETSYRGPGEVEIKGRFGDGKALEGVLASRAVKDIDGLTKVSILNLDQKREAKKAEPAVDKRIVSMIGGTDPYVITADGSRYFAGAELPCGGRLVAIEGDQVTVEDAAGVHPAQNCKREKR